MNETQWVVLDDLESELPPPTVLRWVRIIVVLLALFALISGLHRFYSAKFRNVTGEASWIWVENESRERQPKAVFAVRTFVPPKLREYVRVKVGGDPEYSLYMNGVFIGSGVTDEKGVIDVYEIDKRLIADGPNQIMVAGRSASGWGGLIAAVDFGAFRQNEIVTGRSWQLYDQWTPAILRQDAPSFPPARIEVLGRPPAGRWDYLTPNSRESGKVDAEALRPRATSRHVGGLPEVRVVSGVAVLGVTQFPFTAFDFGPVVGRIKIALPRATTTRAVRIRYASTMEELEQIGEPSTLVIARGETAVVAAVAREFRFVAVYDENPEVTVLPEG